jgi:2,5-diketo-D-gluconate reductase A
MLAACLASSAVMGAMPTITLNNGVDMPVMAVGTANYHGANATRAVRLALASGFTHVHTAFDYFNLPYVATALEGQPRRSIFLSSMVSPCAHPSAPPKRNVTDPVACHNLTLREAEEARRALRVDAFDLLMLHGPSEAFLHVGPCSALACELNAAQWRAMTTLLHAQRARAIGVSNFCSSCLACLLAQQATIVPAVNQIQLHVGMHADPGGLVSHCASRGIVVQAYEPLAGGAVATDHTCATIGRTHNRSAAQVGLRWLLDRAPSLVVRAGSAAHLRDDLDVWGWGLSPAELAMLDAQDEPKGEAGGRCSWGCTE